MDQAISSAYRLSGGQLRNFLPGSPFMVLIEVLVFAQMEFLHWAENLPDALVLSLFSKALGVGILNGTHSTVTVAVTLTTALPGPFTIPKGAALLSSLDQSKEWALAEDLTIAPGSTLGTATAIAASEGPASALSANELTAFEAEWAFVQSVSNSLPSTVGSAPESVADAQENIKALMSQRSPTSEEDWVNVVKKYLGPLAVAKVIKDTPNLKIYVKNLSPGPQLTALEAEIDRQRTLLQKVQVLPYQSIGLDLEIRYVDSTPSEGEAINIANNLNDFISDTTTYGASQPVDLYERFASFTGNTNLADFRVQAYGADVLLWNKPLRTYDFAAGQVTRDLNGTYYQASGNITVVETPFDEAELGLLDFYPVLENFTGGVVEKNYVVQYLGTYYKVLKTEVFNPANALALSAPTTWSFALPLSPADFVLEPSATGAFSYGFIPTGSYTTATDWILSLTALAPQALNIGSVLNPGDVWFLSSQPEVLYIAASGGTVTQALLATQAPTELASWPQPQGVDHWLLNHGPYRMGLLTPDKNYVIVSQDNALLPVPPGIDTELLAASAQSPYGTLYKQGQEVYEFTSGLLTFRRATREVSTFAFITYPGSVPYFLRVAQIKFLRGQANDPEKTVIENGSGGYVIG
jgi:Baseplate J-like protein